jgi:hypothetical protein
MRGVLERENAQEMCWRCARNCGRVEALASAHSSLYNARLTAIGNEKYDESRTLFEK